MESAQIMLQDECSEEIHPQKAYIGKAIDQEEEDELIRKLFDQDIVQAQRENRYEDEKCIQRSHLSGP